ncbi:RIP metalloprotease RseP [Anaplasma bovis]|uniref:RIP metalloprotease RseP n=1 Tax=Anaplasma bovis TaxID=186733 RepID=UPI002FF0D142
MLSLAHAGSAFQEGFFYVASFLFVLSVVVFVHEYGHYLAARLCGIKVETFSLGFGPELFGVTDSSGTRWKFSLVPVGGYVRMFGDASDAEVPEGSASVALNGKPLWQRAIVAIAGPGANLLFSVLVFFLLFSTRGAMTPLPVVGSVLPGGVADSVGIMAGDRIVTIDGNKISWFEEIRHHIANSSSEEVIIGLMRGNKLHHVVLGPDEWVDNASRKLGIAASISPENIKAKRMTVVSAAAESVRCVARIVKITLTAVRQLVTGSRGMDELGGPVRIAKHSGESIRNKEGLRFIGLISANLGVINLLPLPMLDGGYVLQYILQGVFRRNTIDPRCQSAVMMVGFFLLMSLMIFVTFNDVRSILK